MCNRVAIEEFKVKGNKEKRILDVLEPIMASHRLIFDPRAIRDKDNQLQITRMQDKRGAMKHDDRIDILASAVSRWSSEVVVNPDTVIERNKEKEHQETIKQWLGNKRMSVLLGDRYYGQKVSGIETTRTPNVLDRFYRR
jgi:hypothetical protein